MLDRIITRIADRPESLVDASYSPEQVITGHKLVKNDGTELSVLLPGWHGGGLPYKILGKRILNSGQDVLYYTAHDQLLEPNVDRVFESFNVLADIVANDLEKLKANYRKIRFVATSLGTVSLGVIAQRFKDFDSATIVVGGSSLAKGVWEGARTTNLKSRLEDDGIGFEELEDRWSSLAPANNAHSLAGRSINMYIASTDIVIPSVQQEELVCAVKSTGAEPMVTTTASGHYWASIGFCLRGAIQGS